MKKGRTYPIYRLWIHFNDKEHNVDNSRMFKERLSSGEVLDALRDFIDRNLDAKRTGSDGEYTLREFPGLTQVEIGCKYLRHETWCCNWFNHYTFNTHLTDEELLESFSAYVARHQDEQLKPNESLDEHRERTSSGNYICLMGADDRWRWEVPCRCKDCQKRGVVTIDH